MGEEKHKVSELGCLKHVSEVTGFQAAKCELSCVQPKDPGVLHKIVFSFVQFTFLISCNLLLSQPCPF